MPTKATCYTCRHFYITYEPTYPYGCRAMGFKSTQIPCVVVQMSSGIPCQAYEKKEPVSREKR
ncbi:MAG: uracil-DNA glycosylase [Deltaproteobacteria bacterium]|nr:MAG: uracil-DNA glycosylase [Deltaproteobacteria bacterium]